MDFNSSLAKILALEGGYVNDPKDPGGETKYGISKRAYPLTDIAALTPESAGIIYRRDYWDACCLDSLSSPLNFIAFDTAVNQGCGFARNLLASTRDITEFVSLRMAHYRINKNWELYGKGWTNRVLKVLTFALGGT